MQGHVFTITCLTCIENLNILPIAIPLLSIMDIDCEVFVENQPLESIDIYTAKKCLKLQRN